MHCREFRSKHVGFVDDLLPAVEMEAMQRHLAECASCSRQNTAIRRSLLLVRNLPAVEPSPDFMRRLNQRLAELGPQSRLSLLAPRPRYSSIAIFASIAAGIAAAAVIAAQTTRIHQLERAAATRTVATAPLPPGAILPASVTPAQLVNQAMMASVPTGIPVWPAMLMAGQAPVRLASLNFHDGESSR